MLKIGGHTIDISSRDKLFFPEAGLTKGDLIDYLTRPLVRFDAPSLFAFKLAQKTGSSAGSRTAGRRGKGLSYSFEY